MEVATISALPPLPSLTSPDPTARQARYYAGARFACPPPPEMLPMPSTNWMASRKKTTRIRIMRRLA